LTDSTWSLCCATSTACQAPLVPVLRNSPSRASFFFAGPATATGAIQVGLLEHERHPQHARPEVERRLPVGARSA
jgi:hypothetical protein